MGIKMGKLVSQTIKTLFGGVSTQPPLVRRDNQVEDAVNATPSVVTGGIEKRPNLVMLGSLKTLENLLLYSEDFSQADWTKTNVSLGVPESVITHPFGNAVTKVTDTSSTNFGTVSQSITPDVSKKYIFSIDILSGTLSDYSISITGSAGTNAQCSVSGSSVTISGGNALDGGRISLGGGWFRVWVLSSIETSETSITTTVTLGGVGSDTGSIYVSRAQLEVPYEDNLRPFAYAYTTSEALPREPLLGSGTEEYKIHAIDRSSQEQYIVLIGNGNCYVYDSYTCEPKQVIVNKSTKWFGTDLLANSTTSSTTTQIWYASWDKNIVYTSSWRGCSGTITLLIEHSTDGMTFSTVQSQTITTASGTNTFSSTALGSTKYVRVRISAAGTAGYISVKGEFRDLTYLNYGAPYPEDFSVVSVVDHTFICNKRVFVSKGPVGHPDGNSTVLGTYQKFTSLPAASSSNVGKLAKVSGDDIDNFTPYWVLSTQEGSTYFWKESVDPNISNQFDNSTMPFELIKHPTGRFLFGAASWEPRRVGDEETLPMPLFVGKPINHVFFFRGRLGVISDETVVLSRADNVYAFFAEKATTVLDTDPIDRTVSTDKVSVLLFASPLRKTLFLTSSAMQFELSSGDTAMTSKTASLDPTTTYTSSSICAPVVMGDVLYFIGLTQSNTAVVFEYFFDQDSYTNTAIDVTKHVFGFLQGDIIQMVADPTTGTLVLLNASENGTIYVYTTFWDDDKKVMSSWVKYTFGDWFIHGMAIFSGFLVLVVEKDNTMYIEQMPLSRFSEFRPMLDHLIEIKGNYNIYNNTTTWTVPYKTTANTKVVLSENFNSKYEVLNTMNNDYTLVATGKYDDYFCYVGEPYKFNVLLSPIYLRTQDGVSIVSGTLLLKDIKFYHSDTVHYVVQVQPEGRIEYSYEFTTTKADTGQEFNNLYFSRGTFTVPIKTKASTVNIKITNESIFPCTLVSAQWRGFYTDITQGG